MRKLLISASIVAVLAAGPAFAKNDKKPTPTPTPLPAPTPAPTPTPTPSISGPVGCASGDLSTGVIACSGFFEGNLLGGSKAKLDGQSVGLKALGFDFGSDDWGSVTKIDSLNGSKTLNFGETLYGFTYIGLHFGGGGPTGVGNGTAFYKLDVGNGLENIFLKYQGSSGAVLYRTAQGPTVNPPGGGNGGAVVPEPATWAMMIGGFGLLGAAVRRRRRLEQLQPAT
jgi:hypothetical protein